MSAGSKRSWDGDLDAPRKRYREEPRDWRDVYMRSPGGRGRDDSRSARPRDGRDEVRNERNRGGGHRHSREDPRDRYRRRSRERSRRDSRSRRDEPHRSLPRSPRSPRKSPSRSYAPPEEREEGEISPRPPYLNGESGAFKANGEVNGEQQRQQQHREVAPSNAVQKIQPAAEPEPELDIVSSPPPVEESLAARRARRQAIMAKYAGLASGISTSVSTTGTPGASSAGPPPPTSSVASDHLPQNQSISQKHGVSQIPVVPPSGRQFAVDGTPTPDEFTLAKADGEGDTVEENNGAEQVSAADYDPSKDRREDEQRRLREPPRKPEAIEEEDEVEAEEDDVDDMFAVATSVKKVRKVKKKISTIAPALITTTLDSASDPEGYYSVILGEQLDGGRYQVFSSLGKGMFANVVRARLLQGEPPEIGKEVAIKIVRCQESMYRAGLKEVQILNKLKQADPEDKKHVVRLEHTFEHRGHLCLVFESLSMNLREVVKRFGKDIGLNIKAVRAYAQQLFTALNLLKKLNIMHADIKPDNILVNEAKTIIKLCDLGSASDASENEITPYLVSRFYRAPEIILGIPYDPSLDIWSLGCTLFELYTGKILFPGRSNNQMLLFIMELRGRFNTKMVKKAKFGDVYFDDMGAFDSVERDRVTGADVIKKVHISKPTRDLRSRLMPPSSVKMKDDEMQMLLSFIDLLDKCLTLDPSRRLTPREALAHPFIRGL